MYRHTAKAIKLVANILAALGVLASLALGALLLTGDNVRIAGATLNGGARAVAGIGVIVAGAFLSWTAGLLVHGFGELLEKTKDNNYLLSRIAAHTKDLHDQARD